MQLKSINTSSNQQPNWETGLVLDTFDFMAGLFETLLKAWDVFFSMFCSRCNSPARGPSSGPASGGGIPQGSLLSEGESPLGVSALHERWEGRS